MLRFRDVKPANLLLDDKGFIHLTDFNIATKLNETQSHASSFAGTMAYTGINEVIVFLFFFLISILT